MASTVGDIYGPYKGVVENVHDGDTVDVKIDLGFDLTVYARVRIKGINAPELSTDAGKAARDFAQTILPVGSSVQVRSYGWDKYGGRIDGAITLTEPVVVGGMGMRDFGTIMLQTDHAVPYPG